MLYSFLFLELLTGTIIIVKYKILMCHFANKELVFSISGWGADGVTA